MVFLLNTGSRKRHNACGCLNQRDKSRISPHCRGGQDRYFHIQMKNTAHRAAANIVKGSAKPNRSSAQYPQGAGRIRKAAEPPTAALRVVVGKDARPQASVSERNRRTAAALGAEMEQRHERALTFEKSRSKRYKACSDVVRMMRLERTRQSTHAPQTCLSTDSSTSAYRCGFCKPLDYYSGHSRVCQAET